ncbi:hypothetical protein ACFSKM_07125 [Ancylobacter dichloromethanicus]
MRAFDAERVVAVIAAGNAEPGTPGYAEMTLIAPAVLSATYPATLTDDPIDTARPQRRDYQIGVLRGRIVVQVQRGPIDRATDLNPRSSIRAFSISENDIRTGRAGWRGEPLLGTPELEPQYGWHMVDGFGNDRQSLFLVNEVTGALSRYDAPINAALLARARDTGSPALLAQAREDIVLDDPKRATDIAPHLAPLLAGGPLVNVGGLLVALGGRRCPTIPIPTSGSRAPSATMPVSAASPLIAATTSPDCGWSIPTASAPACRWTARACSPPIISKAGSSLPFPISRWAPG